MQKSRIHCYTLILLGIVCVFQSCKLVDIRTTEVKESYDSEKGLDILNQMSKAHSLEQWDSITLYSLHLKDEFYGLMGKFGNPFPNNVGEFDLSLIPNTFTSQATFTDAKWAGNIWGIQSWKTYSNLKSDALKFHTTNDKNIELLIQYTVRDQYKWLHATLVYDSYNNLHGVLIPDKMSISLSLPSEKKLMHQITISNIVINDKKDNC